MLFRQQDLEGIRRGTITLAFRRWRRAAAKTGGTQMTAAGQLQLGDVSVVGMEKLSFKTRVRRLKQHGLSESLETGYRLSPRGEALLHYLGAER